MPSSSIDRWSTDAVGNPAPVTEGVVTRLRAGAYLEAACAAVDVSAQTVYGWLRTGAEAYTKVSSGYCTFEELTEHQQKCLEFKRATERAEAEWQVRTESELERICRGGQVTKRTTVRKDPKGNVIETIEVEEHQPPDPKVLQWRLERRFPDRYGRRTTTEVNVGGQVNHEHAHTAYVDTDALVAKIRTAAATAGPAVAALDVSEAR